MKPMSTIAARQSAHWYRSFYFRIGFSFVVFVVAVLAAQSAMFGYIMARTPFPGRSSAPTSDRRSRRIRRATSRSIWAASTAAACSLCTS
jgi:hypothetical protein